MASTHSPTLTLDESPSFKKGNFFPSTFKTAISLLASEPINFAINSRLSLSLTIISSAFFTT